MHGKSSSTVMHPAIFAAREAHSRGWQATPVRGGSKAPYYPSWTSQSWDTADDLMDPFLSAIEAGADNIGLILGEPSNGLVDVDLDSPTAVKLAPHLLPPTAMVSGRSGSPNSHWWYVATGTVPKTSQWRGKDRRSMLVELRSTGGQTVIPPSLHPSESQPYLWAGQPWGGDYGPTEIDGTVLHLQVTCLALATVLVEDWAESGSRHDAYLCLAGALLRHGDERHEWWQKNLPPFIRAIAGASGDEDGKHKRVSEVMGTTLRRLDEGEQVKGWPSLAEIIGEEATFRAREIAQQIDDTLQMPAIEGPRSQAPVKADYVTPAPLPQEDTAAAPPPAHGDPTVPVQMLSGRDPMAERVDSWATLDLEPYLTGEVVPLEPTLMQREDGPCLMYAGRVNSLFGSSESAKTWLALHTCRQAMAQQQRVLFLDLEDDPSQCILRLQRLDTPIDDIRHYFRYARPEGPLAPMMQNRYGSTASDGALLSHELLLSTLQAYDPHLIVVDGMTQLYAYHGLDPSDALATATISNWFVALTRNSRTCVLVLDHEAKDGNTQFGSQHKKSMVSGVSLRAEVVDQPKPGALGKVTLQVAKDRHGGVRENSSDSSQAQVAGVFVIDSREEGTTTITIEEPPAEVLEIDLTGADVVKANREAADAAICEEIYQCLPGFQASVGASTQEVSEVTGHQPRVVRKAWQTLTEQHRISVQGSTKARRYKKAE